MCVCNKDKKDLDLHIDLASSMLTMDHSSMLAIGKTQEIKVTEDTFPVSMCCHYLGFCAGGREQTLINKILKEGNKDFPRLSINAVENTIYIIQKLGYEIKERKDNV